MSRTGRNLAALTAAHALVGSLVAVSVRGPLLAIDDIAFLSMGRSIAGNGGAAIGAQPPYGVLYPVLLAPGWLVGLDESQMVVYAQVLNAVLGALLLPVLYLLVRRSTTATEGSAILAALIGASLPTALLTGTIAWTERLLPLLLAMALLGVSLLQERVTAGRVATVVGAAVGLFATHPRTGAAAIVLVGAAIAWPMVRTRLDLAVIAAAAGLGGLRLAEWLRDRLSRSAFGDVATYDTGQLVDRRGLDEVPHMVVHAGGTVAYLVIATAGLAVLGALVLLSDRWMAATVGGVLIGTVAVAGWFLTGVDRADAWLHGRYIEILAPPLVAFGVIGARNLSWKLSAPLLGGSVVVAGFYGAWAGPGDNFGSNKRSPVMMLGTEVSGAPFGGTFFEVGAAASVGLVVGLLMIAAAHTRPQVTAVVATLAISLGVWSGLAALESLQENSVVGQVQASALADEDAALIVIDTDRVARNLTAAVAWEAGLDHVAAELTAGATHLLLPADEQPPSGATLVAEFSNGSVWRIAS
ncbi:MAG: hypothetical protein P8J50_19115 [Acidimicrobiales bacterium]|nr:hypothetical protein [Acidimicrobiales bacterium]